MPDPGYTQRGVVTGIRGGKTTGGIFDVQDKSIRQPGHFFSDIDAGEPYIVAIAAPLHATVQEVIRYPFCRTIPPELVVRPYHAGERNIKIRGKYGETWIFFFSAKNPFAWQGRRWNGFWMDEFPLCPELAYDEAQGRLADRQGWILLTGTPQGPNWAKQRIYDPWLAGDQSIWFHTWKTIDNPWMATGPGKAYIEEKRRTLPAKYFKRAFEASWDVFEGQVYEEFVSAVHILADEGVEFVLPSGHRTVRPGSSQGAGRRRRQRIQLAVVIAGVDWGYGGGHAGAIVVCGLSRDGTWYVLEASKDEGVLVAAQGAGDSWVKRARALRTKWEVETFFCDNQAPGSIGQLRAAALPAEACYKGTKVREQIERVAMFVHPDEESGRPKMFFLKDLAAAVIDEMLFYHWLPGTNREEPAKINDHTMDALRYAIYTYLTRGTFRREIGYTAA
jgi:hypothetical protein